MSASHTFRSVAFACTISAALGFPASAHAGTTLTASAEPDGSHRARIAWEFTSDESLYMEAKVFRSEVGPATSALGGPGQIEVDYIPLREANFAVAEAYTTGDSFYDRDLTNRTTYYYTVFVRQVMYDTLAERWAGPATANVVPRIRTIEEPQADSADHALSLTWSEPFEQSAHELTRVLMSTTGFATHPTPAGDQRVVYEQHRNAENFVDGYRVPSLVNERHYYLTWFAKDGDGTWSLPATATGVPTEYNLYNEDRDDPGPPRLTLPGFFPDHGWTEEESRAYRVTLQPGQTINAYLPSYASSPRTVVKPTRRELVLFAPAAAFDGAAVPVAVARAQAFGGWYGGYYPPTLYYTVAAGAGGDYYLAIRRKDATASDDQHWRLFWDRHSGSGAFTINIARKSIWTHPQDRKKRSLDIRGAVTPGDVAAGAPGGTVVALQTKKRGKWVVYRWYPIERDGSFYAYLRLNRNKAPITWRLYMPAYGGCAKATTPARTTR